MSLQEAVGLVEKIKEYEDTHRLEFYKPYPYQQSFHHSRSLANTMARQRLLMAANKVGKTFCGAAEVAYHLTGRYPDWWTGHRFSKPIHVWAAGNTNANTRDIVQAELLGEPGDPEDWGRGAIPREFLGKVDRLPGIPNAIQAITVKHISGRWSKLNFKAYEQGKEQWMGKAVDVVWLDEEPPQDIYSQALRATLKSRGLIFMTFTPEKGMTQVVRQFMNEIRPNQALYQATWDDAFHLDADAKDEILAALPPHEREMRSKGIPVLGSGLVFPVPEDDLVVDGFDIPKHWARLCGMDFGWDHPTAAVWIAYNRDADIVYVYDCYRKGGETPMIHAEAIKARGDWIPVVWPHDGIQHDKGSGESLSKLYRKQGVRMLGQHFTNPDGTMSVESGLMSMLQRMQTGRFKVFKHLSEWFEEFRQYHRMTTPTGQVKIVKVRDDLMSATRYAAMSLQYATLNQVQPLMSHALGTFDKDYQYFS